MYKVIHYSVVCNWGWGESRNEVPLIRELAETFVIYLHDRQIYNP